MVKKPIYVSVIKGGIKLIKLQTITSTFSYDWAIIRYIKMKNICKQINKKNNEITRRSILNNLYLTRLKLYTFYSSLSIEIQNRSWIIYRYIV